jgi:hypothetical protein
MNPFKKGDKVIPSKTDINFEDYGNLGMKKALPITNINGEFIKWGGT